MVVVFVRPCCGIVAEVFAVVGALCDLGWLMLDAILYAPRLISRSLRGLGG